MYLQSSVRDQGACDSRNEMRSRQLLNIGTMINNWIQCWNWPKISWGVRCRNVWNFAQGLKFKANFHSKMSICRHELGFNPPPPTIPTLGKSLHVWAQCVQTSRVPHTTRCTGAYPQCKLMPNWELQWKLIVSPCKDLTLLFSSL